MKSLIPYSFEILVGLSVLFGLLSVAYFVAIFKAFRRLRLIKVGTRLVLFLIFAPLALLTSGIVIGLQGYNQLTREDLIAFINIKPKGEQRFLAQINYVNGLQESYLLEGDEVQVDANIIKWKHFANFFGLHTHYELTRISGRYRDLDDARSNKISAHNLKRERLVDLVKLRVKNESLSFLMDAEYGSGAFLPANKIVQYELKVSTDGLLLRKAK
ncbi:hypothetical protein [Pleionea sediminis]|uniref:hypothetical protein n=1 Tax=Pleionea sediminis TaxID=2569479 RepID=UPI0011856BFC|nr:hypothetical protein [Pleionea sediminis]